MAFYDLREFINALESRGMLKRIKTPVDCNLEITEITDRVSKMEGKKNVALLFENVTLLFLCVLPDCFVLDFFEVFNNNKSDSLTFVVRAPI